MPVVKIETTMGDITVDLDAENAPIGSENFIHYVMDGYYTDTIFHRIIPGFMVQGGGMVEGMQEKPAGDPIENESDNGLKNNRGTLAYARTGNPHSATTQFFINLVDNTGLDFNDYKKLADYLDPKGIHHTNYGYAVFGKVTDGMDVVDAMAKVETTNRMRHQDVPVDDIKIIKTVLLED